MTREEAFEFLDRTARGIAEMFGSTCETLVHDMGCIETLARVDTLCVDKTGTITEPSMEVTDIFPLASERFSYEDIEKILAAFYYGEEPDNETAKAMALQFGEQTSWHAVRRIPFSSSTKWSAADFGEHGRYVIGAPEFVMGDRYDSIRDNTEPWSARGCRVLLLASYESTLDGPLDSALVTPIALIYLSNEKLYPLQLFLRNILLMDQMTEMMEGDSEALQALMRRLQLKESMKYGIVVLSSLPVLVIYPFLQKYFVKGMMIGAIKG